MGVRKDSTSRGVKNEGKKIMNKKGQKKRGVVKKYKSEISNNKTGEGVESKKVGLGRITKASLEKKEQEREKIKDNHGCGLSR